MSCRAPGCQVSRPRKYAFGSLALRSLEREKKVPPVFGMRTSAFELQTAPDSRSRSNWGAETAGQAAAKSSEATSKEAVRLMGRMLLQTRVKRNRGVGFPRPSRGKAAASRVGPSRFGAAGAG